jgi:hypothetical protein
LILKKIFFQLALGRTFFLIRVMTVGSLYFLYGDWLFYSLPVLKIASAFSTKFFFAEDFLGGLPQKFEGFFLPFFIAILVQKNCFH